MNKKVISLKDLYALFAGYLLGCGVSIGINTRATIVGIAVTMPIFLILLILFIIRDNK